MIKSSGERDYLLMQEADPIFLNRQRSIQMDVRDYTKPISAEGPDNADVMLVGQNPGREEAAQGRPFVGRSGRYLDQVLQKFDLDRDKLYITAVVKVPTPGNRMPNAREVRQWMDVLENEIKQVKPEIVVLMGQLAWKTPRHQGIEYIETYHPAAAMRFPKARERFEKDFEELSRKIRGFKSSEM